MGTRKLMELQLELRQVVSRSEDRPSTKKLDDSPGIANTACLQFEDISYSVRSWFLSRERRQLLKNVNGEFRPGELTAIMGISGAGKSTLMNVLAGFITSGVSGSVMVNSKIRNMAKFREMSAYIMQQENLQPLLTVSEAMDVAADLKLNVDHYTKKKKIDQILVAMGLEQCRHKRASELSGGERKRLAIALELISSPPIMFLDEPTSGLDYVTSKHCITLLKQLAKAGRTIVCTIHHPSASILNMIDHVYVVAEGSCVYSGSSQNLVPYLRNFGLECPIHYNPADYLMEVCSGDYGKHIAELVQLSENGRNQSFRSTSIATSQDDVIALSVLASFEALRPQTATSSDSLESKENHTLYAANFWKQLRILLKRNVIKLSRDKVLTVTRLSMHFVIALLVGTIYFRIGQDAVYVLDNFNMLFFNIMFLMFSAFSATITTFPLEMPIITCEYFNRWYRISSIYVANKLADFPIQLTAICMYILIVYYMSDQLLELRRFCLYTLICFAISMVAHTAGLLLGTGMSIQNGMILGPLVILPFLVFSGFFVHLRDAHPYLHWLFHISFIKYGFEGVMIAIYGYDRPKLPCSDVYCHFAIPETLLNAVDMKHADYWFCIVVLTCLYFALDIGAYTMLTLKLGRHI